MNFTSLTDDLSLAEYASSPTPRDRNTGIAAVAAQANHGASAGDGGCPGFTFLDPASHWSLGQARPFIESARRIPARRPVNSRRWSLTGGAAMATVLAAGL